MSYYDSKFYSLSFTIIVIITMFTGIAMSVVYSKSLKHLLVKNSLQPYNDKIEIHSTFYYDDSSIIKPYIAKFELYNHPSSSVPVKLQLGKIIVVSNPNTPKLDLLLSAIDKVAFQTELNNHFNHNISHNYWSSTD
jgi:hypothetical protein